MDQSTKNPDVDEDKNLSYKTTNLLITVHQNDAKSSWFKLSSGNNLYVISLANVVDVNGNRGVCPNTMFFHKSDEFRLR